MTKKIKRTKKGRFAKGTCGGLGKESKKDSPVPSSKEIRDAFYKAFVEIFVKGGSVKELVAFCKKNQTNMKLLISEVRKILPEIAAERDPQAEMPAFIMPRPKLTVEVVHVKEKGKEIEPEPEKKDSLPLGVEEPKIEEPKEEKKAVKVKKKKKTPEEIAIAELAVEEARKKNFYDSGWDEDPDFIN